MATHGNNIGLLSMATLLILGGLWKKIILIFLICFSFLGGGCSEKYSDDFFSSFTGSDASNSGESTEIQDSSSSGNGDGVEQDDTSFDKNDEADKDDSSTELPPPK